MIRGDGSLKTGLTSTRKIGITPVLSPAANVSGPLPNALTKSKKAFSKFSAINVPSNSPTGASNEPEMVTGDAVTFVRLPLNDPEEPATNVCVGLVKVITTESARPTEADPTKNTKKHRRAKRLV
ncbi:MAG: hypothetical protein ABR594_11955 [Pyrinomonadaceae bacterium]